MTPCIIWTGAKNLRGGYGVRKVGGRKGKIVYMHRQACEEANGPPPSPKHMALHRCNTPACINGEHLYWGDKKQNAEDSRRDGTMAIGEKHGCAKLSREQVLEIRMSEGSSYQIASLYGIAASTVRGIRNGNGNWKWLHHL